MATAFSDIYSRAISRFSEYDLLNMSNDDKEALLLQYLTSAQADFQDICHTDLRNKNTAQQCYVDTLSDIEQEILALGIAYYWLSSKVLNSELLRDRMSTLDYSFHSGANLLKEMVNLRGEIATEYRSKMNLYSYRNGNIDSLKA